MVEPKLRNSITSQGWKYIYNKLLKLDKSKYVFYSNDDETKTLLPLVANVTVLNYTPEWGEETQNKESVKNKIAYGTDNDIISIKLTYELFLINGQVKLNNLHVRNSDEVDTFNAKTNLYLSDSNVNKLNSVEVIYTFKSPQYLIDKNRLLSNLMSRSSETHNMALFLGTGTYSSTSTIMNQPVVQIPITTSTIGVGGNGTLLFNVDVANPDVSNEYSEFGIGYQVDDITTDPVELVYYKPISPKHKFDSTINLKFELAVVTDSSIQYTGTYSVEEQNILNTFTKQLEFSIYPDEIGEFSYITKDEQS